MDTATLKALETKLTSLVEQHKELKAKYALAQQEIARLRAGGAPAVHAATGGGDESQLRIDTLLREREEVRQKVENMIKALEDFEE